jgi:uncharacterized membrane protein YgcG
MQRRADMGTQEWLLLGVVLVVPLVVAITVTLWTLEQAMKRNRKNRPDRSARRVSEPAAEAHVAGGSVSTSPGRREVDDDEPGDAPSTDDATPSPGEASLASESAPSGGGGFIGDPGSSSDGGGSDGGGSSSD